MNRTRTLVAAGALALGLAVPVAPAATATILPFGTDPTIGLSGERTLVGVNLARPGVARSLGAVTGLQDDTSIIGIDRRPADGKLYAVGNRGGVYTVSVPTLRIVKKAPSATLVNRLSVALSGSSFGVDFNPAADRLRIISDTGQNLRHDVNPGGVTITDGTLAYAPATTPATGVTAAAYTNNDTDPVTATTLFDIDTTLDQVAVQSPANAGSLAPTGKLGVDATKAGFDIDTRNDGWATLTVGGTAGLYSVDLLAGSVRSKGAFPRSLPVHDLALPIR